MYCTKKGTFRVPYTRFIINATKVIKIFGRESPPAGFAYMIIILHASDTNKKTRGEIPGLFILTEK